MTPRRRKRDRGWRVLVRDNAYRDVWLLIITGLSLLAIWLNHATLQKQAQGRRFAVGVTCATLSAISEAGRQVLAGPQGPETPFDRALERLGYPPPRVRKTQQRQAAELYVRHISESVQQQVGGRGAHLIRRDGTLDCAELQRLAAIHH